MLPRTISLATTVLALTTPAATAQGPNIPPGLTGLPTHGEIPYSPGSASYGPTGPVDSPAEDADTRAYSQAFWQVVDNGGSDPTPVTSFEWTAPAIVDMLNGDPAADPDP